MVDLFMNSVQDEWHGLVELSPRLILSLIIFLISIVVGQITRRGTMYWLSRSDIETTKKTYFSRVIGWIPVVIGFLVALAILNLETMAAGLLAGGGLIAVIFGFAFRQIGENFLAGFILAFNRPFREKDYIRSSGYEGTVQDIQLRYTHIRTQDGRDIFLPNARIFTEPMENYTLDGLRRFEWLVGIDYRDDAAKAVQLIRERIRGIEGVLQDPPAGANISGFEGNWVQLSVLFWVDVFATAEDLPRLRTEVAEAVRTTLLENGFTVSAEVSTNINLMGQPESDAPSA